ncbi:phospholipase D-like domain-containing protein [Micromonospora sp. WMMA1363]|uniref:phospholipase D family protein n=1 Tax=Micromonospora sp. WMMA1363 TaxID=3053985 RepID=UPI00259C6DAE|nr:phospholipase D-like domain-containing protein [Micromonospora sp. WMMA1363]MDM4718362.1 phospholipase D-like domain-containing protein [Micromonospora sp. WMMA1363]
MVPHEWLLSAAERGNPRSELPVWTSGNLAEPLIHGAAYFDRLAREVEALEPGDHLFFFDWRGDPDERMRPDGPPVCRLFARAARRGAVVKGLIWRSHLDVLTFSEEENRNLSEEVDDAGGQVLLDQRVRRGGSHHQKLVVLRHPRCPERDIAFAGGIDLCHSRRDGAEHHGDPQAVRMSRRYGERPPWHDSQLALRGPVVGVLDGVFRERWADRAPLDSARPLAYLRDRLFHADLRPNPLPDQPPPPPACGPHHIQVLRTYPRRRPRYPFAPAGERTVARGYLKALRRARRLIYLENPFLWSSEVADVFARSLRANPRLHMIAVMPRHPGNDSRLSLPPNLIGQERALSLLTRTAPGRLHVFDVENHAGIPVYVHAKICVVDDVWATVGSDNLNLRSWTYDSELSCAVVDDTRDRRDPVDPAGIGDGARVFARELRLRLLREHLDRDPDGGEDADLLDPTDAVNAVTAAADALQRWYDGGQAGPRPPGRLRPYRPGPLLPWYTRAWALPLYRLAYDPDGRPLAARRAGTW